MKFSLSSPKKQLRENGARPSLDSQNAPSSNPQASAENGDISPELVPIVTLLSAQTHRRYHEGTFMLYNDLNGDGNPADREWKEVYGILTGNQLAYWDAANLARFKDSPEQLFNTSSKPKYLNFTDAAFSAMTSLPAAKMSLENVLLVSTTLKNRYILQFRALEHLKNWTLALRLAAFEHQSLQEAYTGALLSARGSRLSDIRTILAEKRFNHEDWVKIRYGSGMAWKRCYAVIEPSTLKKKSFSPGRVLLYESETAKKKQLVGEITSATSVTAIYPQSPFFIDQSTIMKLEGSINFQSPQQKAGKSKTRKSAALDSHETSLFLMPESHSSVPGFDTLIRFLIPLYDAFGLYGRPQRLKADRVDADSLVFGLPTLPHVHYLTLEDLRPLVVSSSFTQWDARAWRQNIRNVLQSKMAAGYDGCGSARGFSGAVSSLNSPRLGSTPGSPRVFSESAARPGPAQNTPQMGKEMRAVSAAAPQTVQSREAQSRDRSHDLNPAPRILPAAQPSKNIRGLAIEPRDPAQDPSGDLRDPRGSVQLAEIYHKYSKIETPSDRFGDRNQLLNGSAEEIDEARLPSVMRSKSLRHGPYPENDRHLISSESENESDNDSDSEEEESLSSGSFAKGREPGLLPVPAAYENRNSSYSSVHSPLTQYHEFNQQFSKSVDQRRASNLAGAHRSAFSSESEGENGEISDDSDGNGFSVGAPSPPAPAHGPAQPLPQIQQLSSLHSAKQHPPQSLTPSSGEKFNIEPTGQIGPIGQVEPISVQKSRATRNLNQSLEGSAEVGNKPRYIQMPGSAPNRSPRDFSHSNGSFSRSPEGARFGTASQSAPPQQRAHNFQGQSQEVPGEAYGRNGQYSQNPNVQQRPVYQETYDGKGSVQEGRNQEGRNQETGRNVQGAQRKPPAPQHQQRPHQQPQMAPGQTKIYPQQYQDQSRPGPQAAQGNPQNISQNISQNASQNGPHGISQNGPGGVSHNQGRPYHTNPAPQQYSNVPRQNPQPGPSQSSGSSRPGYPGSSQYQQMPNGYPQQQPQKHQQQPQSAQRHPHPYSSRVTSSDQQGQAYPLQKPPMQHQQNQQQQHHQHQHQQHQHQQQYQNQQQNPNYQVPARPQAQSSQSAQNIRSYGDQQYQYQAQPNVPQGHRVPPQYQGQGQGQSQNQSQRPYDPKADPRNQPAGNHEYMRQY